MAPPNSNHWESDPEYIELMNFLIEKTRDAESPLSIKQLAEEFKQTSGSSQRISCLINRIHRFRSKVHQMDSIDAETELKLLFGLSVPIDANFLNKLRKDAVVEIDDKNRIIKYEANDGSLEMEGDHNQTVKKKLPIDKMNDPEYIEFVNFLIEKTKDVESPLSINQLAEEFKETSGCSQGISCLIGRIYKLRSTIHQMDTIDTEAKVKMLFGLSVPIDDDFLKELRNDAVVDVDVNNRIIEYRANDGSLNMQKVLEISEDKWESDPEYIQLMNFLIEKTRDAESPLSFKLLAEEFKQTSGCSQRISCLLNRIYEFRSKVHQMNSIDTETKVKIIFGLSVPIDDYFLNKLRKDAVVEVDEKRRITKYEANDGSLHMKSENCEDKWNSDPEYIELMKFLIEKTKDAKSPLSLKHLAGEFKENSGSSLHVDSLHYRIKKLRQKICGMDSIDTPTKVKILVGLSGSINEHFLTGLRKDALVEVDENNRITKYRANDGSLEIEGDHSTSAKKKLLPNNPIDKTNDPEYIKLKDFLIEKTRDAKSPLNITKLTKEFKMKNFMRMYTFRMSIHQMDSIDEETKVKMLFALSVPIDKEFLNELRKNAFVEVDEKHRITKYEANDGNLEMEGEHLSGKKIFSSEETEMNQSQNFGDSDENDPDGIVKSVDQNFRRRSALKMDVKHEISTGRPEIVTTRSGRVSKKKINFGDDEIDDFSSSFSVKKKRTTTMKPENQDPSGIESKPFRRSFVNKKDLLNPVPVKEENLTEMEDVKPKFTSKLKFLEAIKSLVVSLDTPTLSRIQSKIQKKIWLIGGSNCGISNDEMIPAMDLLVARISNHSISNLSETVKSVSLKEFLCYLKAVILNSKLEGLEDLLEKIKEKNKTLAMRDKRIPVENVESVLQDTLNNIGF